MHSCNMLTPLIERLINVINNKNSSHLRKNVSALWLDELGNALHKCIVAQNLYQKIPPEVSFDFYFLLTNYLKFLFVTFHLVFIICA